MSEEKAILQEIFGDECDLIGDDILDHLVQNAKDNDKSVVVQGGRDVSFRIVYNLISEALKLLRDIRAAKMEILPVEGPTEIIVDYKKQKVIIKSYDKEYIREVSNELIPHVGKLIAAEARVYQKKGKGSGSNRI